MALRLTIDPEVGFGQLTFGLTMNQVKSLIGEPNEVEVINEKEADEAIVWHFDNLDISVFFETGEIPRMSSVEVFNVNATIWDYRLFDYKEAEIVAFIKSKGFESEDAEVHEWGERRLSFDDLNLDLYFENDILVTVSYGVFLNSEDTLHYPLN
jgi:hypothetical protein